MSAEFDVGTWGVGITGSIIAGMTGSFLIQKLLNSINTNEIRNNVKNVIKEELEINLTDLQNEDLETLTASDGSTEVTHVFLEKWAFESAVKSGNYILLNKDLRKDVSSVYASIGLANRQSDLLTKMHFTINTTELELENFRLVRTAQINNLVGKHRELIPKMESLITQLS